MQKIGNMRLLAVSLVAAVAAAAVPSIAAVDPAVNTAILANTADVLIVVGLGGLAFIAVSGGSVVWVVAAKFIKRLGGKA